MKIAAYQAPLLPSGSQAALGLIRKQIDRCESEGVEILCCPEAILGGLADHASRPAEIAIGATRLDRYLAPLTSETVTTILGFTERGEDGALYNTAAIFHRGSVAGLYRKLHPAIRRSVYTAGEELPVFQIGELTFGILICNDSNFPELAEKLSDQGAAAIFIPTNNALPAERADLSADARKTDIAVATENRVFVIRADVAGSTEGQTSLGSSAITAPDGTVICSAPPLTETLISADIRPLASDRA
ncbi:MAG: carbon-nitrogen hydrolase family protein [Acidobacteriota bacterium]